MRAAFKDLTDLTDLSGFCGGVVDPCDALLASSENSCNISPSRLTHHSTTRALDSWDFKIKDLCLDGVEGRAFEVFEIRKTSDDRFLTERRSSAVPRHGDIYGLLIFSSIQGSEGSMVADAIA